MNDNINTAIEILNNGGIIVFPTDTAFGIGCRIDNENSIKKLFDIRKRPHTQATPVLVGSIQMAQKYLNPLPKDVLNLMEKYWPGALTIIYKCKTNLVPLLVRGGGDTLGVRMPNRKDLLNIINKVHVPILGPSANIHGEKTPYAVNDLDTNLINKVDYIYNGTISEIGNISTVIDCTEKSYKIVRQGKVIL